MNSYLDTNSYHNLIEDGKSYDEYLTDYCNIIDFSLKRDKNNIDVCFEKHHILPKCMGGENENYNYVILTVLEHIIVHILLYRMYPKNPGITKAAFCMLGLFSENVNPNRAVEINNLDIELISKIRNDVILLRNKPIICFEQKNNTINVLKTFKSISDAEKYGISNISTVVSSHKQKSAIGLLWSSEEQFKLDHPEEFSKFENLSEIEKSSLNNRFLEFVDFSKQYLNKEPIVCFDLNTLLVYKIYESISNVTEDGFSKITVSRVVNRSTIRINSENLLSNGYGWMKLREFKETYPDKLENYINNDNPSNKLIPPDIQKKVACLDENKNIIKNI